MVSRTFNQQIKIAHSPDSDDAFMFYAIMQHKIDLLDFKFEFASAEIEILNQDLLTKKDSYDICAASFHTAFLVKDRYQILSSGASMAGADYGPRIIYKDHTEGKIAIPGEFTSANLAWREFAKINQIKYTPLYCSYDEVFELLATNQVDMSLLIHESQLQYQDYGYKLLVDLGAWWYQEHNGLQLPLGANLIRRSLGATIINQLEKLLHKSIKWGHENFAETLEYSKSFANNGLDESQANKYIEMYVNDSTLKLSDKDLESITLLEALL